MLYLEHNRLESLDGLEDAGASIRKVFAGGNRISVLGPCLARCGVLEELSVPGQALPPSVSLRFDPLAMRALSRSLRVLDVSACGLDDDALPSLAPLRALADLNASRNAVSDLAGLCQLVSGLPNLARLDVRANPVADPAVTGAGGAYRAAIIAAAAGSPAFSWLDGGAVKARHRAFVAGLAGRRGGGLGGLDGGPSVGRLLLRRRAGPAPRGCAAAVPPRRRGVLPLLGPPRRVRAAPPARPPPGPHRPAQGRLDGRPPLPRAAAQGRRR
jgi:hypothetical protein